MHGSLWQRGVELPASCASRSWRDLRLTAAAENAELPSSRRGPSGRARARVAASACLECAGVRNESFPRRGGPAPAPRTGSVEHGPRPSACGPSAGLGLQRSGGRRPLVRAQGTPSTDIFDSDLDSDHDASFALHAPSEALEEGPSPPAAEALASEAAAYPDLLSGGFSQLGASPVPGVLGHEVNRAGAEQIDDGRMRGETAGSSEGCGEESLWDNSPHNSRSIQREEQHRQEAAQEAAASMASLAETAVTTSLLGVALQPEGTLRSASDADSSRRTSSRVRSSPGPTAVPDAGTTRDTRPRSDRQPATGRFSVHDSAVLPPTNARKERRNGAAAFASPLPAAAPTTAAAAAAAARVGEEVTGGAVYDSAAATEIGGPAVAAAGGDAGTAVGSEAELESEATRVLTRGQFLRGVNSSHASGPLAPHEAREVGSGAEVGRQAKAHAEAQTKARARAWAQVAAAQGAERRPGLHPRALPSGTVVRRHQAARQGWRLLEEAPNGSPDRSGEAGEPQQSIPRASSSGAAPGSTPPSAGAAANARTGAPQVLGAPTARQAGRRRLFPVRLSHGSLRRALGIPEPGEKKSSLIRARTAAVRERMNAAVRTAQDSAAAEVISGAFFILVPLSIGAVVYTGVGHFISQLGPAPALPHEPEAVTWWHGISDTWHSWMMSGQAAGAAGAFAGFAGVGIAAKTAAPAAALMTSSAGELDSLWRSLGGASLVALYWKTLVFGKTFRAVEWDLLAHSAPEGPMHSVTIRVPSLSAVKTKIALASGIKDSSAIKQLALWVPGSGDFVEPLEDARDLSLVPEMGFIVWSTSPRTQVPFPHRANQRRTPAAPTPWPPEGAGGPAGGAGTRADMAAFIVDAFEAGALGPSVHPWGGEEALTVNSIHPAAGAPGEIPYSHREGVVVVEAEQALSPMSALERDALVCRVARDDAGLQVLYQAFGATEAFVHHALYYIRSTH